ncbi:MAG: hypothetical protein EVA89_35395 [Sandaracinaceae bacterium]|nr:MAG: hypothetical protein EVA89_35395 [Sandaracinaceae bacterium]
MALLIEIGRMRPNAGHCSATGTAPVRTVQLERRVEPVRQHSPRQCWASVLEMGCAHLGGSMAQGDYAQAVDRARAWDRGEDVHGYMLLHELLGAWWFPLRPATAESNEEVMVLRPLQLGRGPRSLVAALENDRPVAVVSTTTLPEGERAGHMWLLTSARVEGQDDAARLISVSGIDPWHGRPTELSCSDFAATTTVAMEMTTSDRSTETARRREFERRHR